MRTRTLLPRSEYPRPDRCRSFVHGLDWLNLNGPWEFRFDGDASGLEKGWHTGEGSRWPEQIIVPFCWESLAAWGEADAATNDHFYAHRVYRQPLEVTGENYRAMPRFEIGWYRRTVVLPHNEHWEGKRVILTIGAADFFTDAWCNGQHLGHHEGGYLPFEFDLTEALTQREDGQRVATLVLRVRDPMQNREQPVGKQWGWYSSASGIWQTVFIEPRAPEFVDRFEVVSDLATQSVRLKVLTSGGSGLQVKITAPDETVVEQVMPVRNGLAECAIVLPSLFLWDTSNPQLYRLTLTLSGKALPDVVHGYFGMRSLSAEPQTSQDAPASLFLNGQPIYIRGALYQSYHAEGVYTAGDVQQLQDDILKAKRAGFDLLRIHIKIDDPLLLFYADTLGMLLMADFPNFGEGGDTPLGRRRFEEMMRGGIARDFNHPSIVAWCLFNETWGFGGQVEFVKLINPTPPETGLEEVVRLPETRLANLNAYTWVQSMWHLAKELDASRLIEDMSVVAWNHLQYYGHGETDVNSWHFYSNHYASARTHIAEVVQNTFPGSTHNQVPGIAQGAQPLINSEYGGVGALDGDVDVSWSFKFLTNELRRHGKLSAYIFTEFHDVEWERNGFFNYDRTPKEFGYNPRLVNQGDVIPIDAPPIQRCRPGETVTIPVSSSHYSRQTFEEVTLFWRLSGVDSVGWLYDSLSSGEQPISFTQFRVEHAADLQLQLPAETMLCTLWVRAVTARGVVVARNFVQFYVDGNLPARQETGDSLILRAEPHTWSAAEWSGPAANREEALATGACHGDGHGYFEWEFPLQAGELEACSCLRVVCEASSHRAGSPQTDSFAHPASFCLSLNGEEIYRGELPNHPHDTRGALSYLREQRGAYGFLVRAVLEGTALQQFRLRNGASPLRLRCTCPDGTFPGGLTIYGGDCGRYPIPLTLILEKTSPALLS